jgi:hypothetical protein
VRWTYSLPEGQVDIRALPNGDAERVAWLRGDSPSATSEEEVGHTLLFLLYRETWRRRLSSLPSEVTTLSP